MHPVKTGAKRKRTVLVLVMALGVGLPPPAQAYLLDLTIASINPKVLISYAGGYPPVPPLIGSNLKVIDASRMDDLKRQPSPTITPPKKNLNFPKGPQDDYWANVPSATSVWLRGGTSPRGSITLQGGIPARKMSGGNTLLRGSFGTASVSAPAPVSGDLSFYGAGSNFTDNKNDAMLTSVGIPRQPANGNFDPDWAASFASAPGALTSPMVPNSNILNHLGAFFFHPAAAGQRLDGAGGAALSPETRLAYWPRAAAVRSCTW